MPPFVFSGHNIDPKITPVYRRSAASPAGLLLLNSLEIEGNSSAALNIGDALFFAPDGHLRTSDGTGYVERPPQYYLGAKPDAAVGAYIEFKWATTNGVLDFTPGEISPGDFPENTWSYSDGMSVSINGAAGGWSFPGVWLQNTDPSEAAFALWLRWIPALLPNPYVTVGQEVTATYILRVLP